MLEVRFSAQSEKFAEDDDRWLSQVQLLHEELRQTAGSHVLVTKTPEPQQGTKGVLPEMVLLLTAPGVVAGVVAAFKAWLSRDRSRRVHVEVIVDGRRSELILTGEAVNTATLQTALEHALRAVGGSDGNPAAGDDGRE